MAGLPCSLGDAADEIKQAAHYISPFGDAQVFVMDVIEKVLKRKRPLGISVIYSVQYFKLHILIWKHNYEIVRRFFKIDPLA
jgi:hypothetical protein